MTAVLRVEVGAAAVDAVVDVLWVHGALGVHEEPAEGGLVRLVSAFEDGTDPSVVAHEVAARVPAAGVSVADDDGRWWDAWRAHAEPSVAAGGRVVVVPAWWDGPVPAGTGGGATVRVDPGRTFGSGAHATTGLVLDELAGLPLAGATVLDVGGGSGVLAVVAAALGASRALAVDIDPVCEAVVTANAVRNGVADRVGVGTGMLAAVVGDERFDVVLANVLLPVLEAVAPAIDRCARRWVVVSGCLVGTERRVGDALPSWQVVRRTERDGWACLLLSRDPVLAEPNEDLP